MHLRISNCPLLTGILALVFLSMSLLAKGLGILNPPARHREAYIDTTFQQASTALTLRFASSSSP